MTNAEDLVGAKRIEKTGAGLIARVAVGDDLGKQRVVVDGHHLTLDDAGIDTKARTRWLSIPQKTSCLRQQRSGVLRVDTALDGVSGTTDLVLAEGQSLAGGDAELQLDQVEAGDGFRHRMLDLQAHVQLEEEELGVVAASVDEKLDRAGVDVSGLARNGHSGPREPLADGRRHSRRGRFFDDFLMPPLERAVAFEQVHDRPMSIAEHLDFDVSRPFDETLDVEGVFAEGTAGLLARRGYRFRDLLWSSDDAHALPAPTRCRLEQGREADGGDGRVEVLVAL